MRGKKAQKKIVKPDILYGNVNLEKFINKLMMHGKKSIARRIMYNALDEASSELKMEPLELFNKIIENISPSVEVKSRRLGGTNYQVPIPVSPDRQVTLSVRWLIKSARDRKGIPMEKRLYKEFIDAYNNTGGAAKKKTDIEKMAESNRAFSHLA